MSDSGSDLSTPANFPTDAEIESGIREVVRAGVNDEEPITVKIARSRTEKALDLPADFFKNDAKWKARSSELITAAFDEFANEEASEEEVEVKPKAKPIAKPIAKPKSNAGTKRKSDETPKAKPKRRKKSPSVEPEESEAEISAEESKTTKPEASKPKPKPQLKSEDTSALSSPPDDEPEPAAIEQNGKDTLPAVDDESDLSSVIDDPPPKKKRSSNPKKSSPSTTSKTKPKAQKQAKASTKSDLSPDEEEIKRLQSYLLKCGIRKLWHRELAPYPTPKDKIKHLKAMLEEVGMVGRFSAEKARQIKEARELKAELEEARRFNEQWGHEEDGEEEVKGGKAKRKEGKVEVEEVVKRRPLGLVDFGDSGEESE